MSLTDEQRLLVAESFAQLVPISQEAAAMFYQRLWELAPESQGLFASSDMAQQGTKLMQTLGLAVRALHEVETITPLLQDLGRRHISYGVTKAQYEAVGEALLWMIEQCLGQGFTPEIEAAWLAAYRFITGITTSVYDAAPQ